MRIVYSGVLLLGAILLCICSPRTFAQTVTYHLHEEPSSTGGLNQLEVSGPDAATTSLQTVDLKGVTAGEYLIQAFDSQLGDPGASGTIASGSMINFTLYMRKSASLGTMTPRAKLFLNSTVGTPFCTATGTTALNTTVTKISLSCKTTATITIASGDRLYLWVGVNLTAVSSSNSFKGELDIEGTTNGNFDSQVGIPVPAATITSLSPATGAVGAVITISGKNFGASKGQSTVTFTSAKTASPTSWSSTQIVAAVPAGTATGNVTVTVGGKASNGLSFAVVPAPAITSTSPASGAAGTPVTIAGSNFGGTSPIVKFNGITATVSSFSASTIATNVPIGATTGNVVVTASGANSNGVAFTVPAPAISSLSPASGASGTPFTISGTNFGSIPGSVTLSGQGASVSNWTNTTIAAVVPNNAITGNVIVTSGVLNSNGAGFTVAPNVTGLAPGSGEPGAIVTISGSNFTSLAGSVSFNGKAGLINSWSNTSISAVVPNGAASGNIVVTAGTLQSNGVVFNVLGPAIGSITPSSGAPGSSVAIAGTNFGTNTGTVTFNGQTASVGTWSDTSIVVTVPNGATTGNVVVNNGGLQSAGAGFTVAPVITAVSPASAEPGTSITITGLNFTATTGTVAFNGQTASISTWSDTTITAVVPDGATSGNIVVTSGTLQSNALAFSVVGPVISSLTPSSGAPGSSVTIAGTNFGASTGTVAFNDQTAAVGTWSETSIVVTVPNGATTGNVVVSNGGLQSSGTGFTVAPIITSMAPVNAEPGSSVTITGLNFTAITGTVTFNGQTASTSNWSDTSITAVVPNGASNGNIVVTAGTLQSNGQAFSVLGPVITILTPSSGAPGTSVTIAGTNFGTNTGTVTFNGQTATVGTWSDTSIVVTVPTGATTGNVVVSNGGLQSGPLTFSVTTSGPTITAVSPTQGVAGSQVTITGTSFGATQGDNQVQVGNQLLTVKTWGDTAIVATIQAGSTTGDIVVTGPAQQSNGVPFTVVVTPVLNGSFGQTVTAVTLTSPLALDWEHWGATDDQPLVRMAGSQFLLSDLSVIGSNSPQLFSDGEIEYLWTDGDVLTAAERTTTGISISGTGNGFHLSVPADAIPKTLMLYVGASNALAQLTASISDNSSAPYVDSSLNAAPGNELSGTYKIDFRAAQPGQTLNIDYIVLADNGNGVDLIGKANLESAELFPHLPDVAITSPVDGQIFTFPSQVSAAVSASQIDFAVPKVDFFSDTQNLFELTASPYSFNLTGMIPGDHVLTASATDVNGLVAVSDPVTISQIQGGGSLSASVNEPADVDLSAGTTDWVHWGDPDSVSNIDRKAGITPQISDLSTLANGDVFTSDDTGRSVNYSWSGGTPTDSQLGTGTQVFMQGYENGFTLTIPADTTVRTAKLYLGYGFGTSRLRASLSDGSAAPWISTFSTAALYEEKVVTFQFQAASVGQSLIISDQVIEDAGFAYVDLESATVSDQNSPVISAISPVTGGPGTTLTISGSNFGDNAVGTVALSGSTLTVNSWSTSSITATLTGGYSSGPVIVSQGLANSNGFPFTYVGPSISSLIPSAGGPGASVTIQGQSLAGTPVAVTFGGTPANILSQTANAIQVKVPAGIALGSSQVVVQVAANLTNPLQFDVVLPPVLTALTPNSGITSKLIRIFGSNFGPSQADSAVFFGETQAAPISWSESVIQVPVPVGFYGGVVTLIVGGNRSNGLPFEVPIRCFVDCNAQRSSISLSPQNLSVVVGEQVDLSVVDDLGETVPFPSFSLSDSSLAAVATSDNIATLNALAPGKVILTAIAGSFTSTTTITIYAGPALPDGTVKWQVPSSIIGVPEQFIQAQLASGSSTATFVRDDTFPRFDVIIRALNENGRELWAWHTGADLNTLFFNPVAPTPAGGFVYTTQLSINSIDANGHPLWSYPFPQFKFQPLTVGYDGTVYALVNLLESPNLLGSNDRPTHLVALDPQQGTEKFRIALPTGHFVVSGTGHDTSGSTRGTYSRPLVLVDGSINVAAWTGSSSEIHSPNSFQAIPRNNSHDPQPQLGSTPIYCPSEVLECWAPVDPSNGLQQTNQVDTTQEQEVTLINVKPDGTPHQFLLSQNQVECIEYGTHYTYVLDDGLLLPGSHVGGLVHDSTGETIADGHRYQQNLGLWFTGTCGVQLPGPNGIDLMMIPNGSGGVLVASETDDNQNPVWIKNVTQPSVSGDGTEMHLTSLNTLNNLVVGENGNAFAAGSWNFFETPRLVSFNMTSGAPNWTYDSPFGTPDDPGYVDIVAAGPNNSLYATEGEFFNQIPTNAFTLDASGVRTDNPTSSQQVNYVASAGIGSNTWFGANVTQVASLNVPGMPFGIPLLMQSSPQLGIQGMTASASTIVDPILSTYAKQHPNGAEDPTGNFRLVPYSDCGGGTRQRHIIYNVLDLSKKPVNYPSGLWYVSEHQTNKCLVQPGCSGTDTDPDFYFFDDTVGGGILPGGKPVESKQTFTVAKLNAKPPSLGPLPAGTTSYKLFVRVPGTTGLFDSDVADYETLGIFLGDVAFVQGFTSYPRVFQKFSQGGGTVLSGQAVCTNP